MRILVVDDDTALCNLLQAVLTRAGHSVEVIQSAFGLCNRVAGRDPGHPAPDMVILDHVLPGLSGGSSLQMLAKDPRTRHVPVILHSSMDPDSLTRESAQHPACWVVPKTGRSAQLLSMVGQVQQQSASAKS